VLEGINQKLILIVSNPLLGYTPTTTTKIFIAPTYTTTIIPFEPSALNVEIQHFALGFSILY
jgi:hypothetical protein